MRRHTALRIGVTLLASAALVAPYAGQFGCAGSPCCGSAMDAHHQDTGANAVAEHVPAPVCPALVSCGARTSATALPVPGAVPSLPVTLAVDAETSSSYRSPTPTHRTPPPRA